MLCVLLPGRAGASDVVTGLSGVCLSHTDCPVSGATGLTGLGLSHTDSPVSGL